MYRILPVPIDDYEAEAIRAVVIFYHLHEVCCATGTQSLTLSLACFSALMLVKIAEFRTPTVC